MANKNKTFLSRLGSAINCILKYRDKRLSYVDIFKGSENMKKIVYRLNARNIFTDSIYQLPSFVSINFRLKYIR